MISVIDSGTVSVTQAISEHTNILKKSSSASLALQQEQLILRRKKQAIDEADKKLKMFLLLKDNRVITIEEFSRKIWRCHGFDDQIMTHSGANKPSLSIRLFQVA